MASERTTKEDGQEHAINADEAMSSDDKHEFDPDETTLHDDQKCGFWKFKPQCLQCFANVNFAFVSLNVAAFLYTFGWGVFATGVTSIQTRYGLPSYIIGLNATLFETATMVAVVFVTYFGGGKNSHRPRWIGFGIIFAAFGTLLVASVHFIYGPYDYGQAGDTSGNVSDADGLCVLQTNGSASPESDCDAAEVGSLSSQKRDTIIILLVGHAIIGAGFSPILTLGTAYIDDYLERKKAPMYFGILYAMYPLGPVVGFPFASLFVSYYVDVNTMDAGEIELTPDDARWVGAWWMGYLVDGILVFFSAIPFLLLPKRLPTAKSVKLGKGNQEEKSEEEMGREIISRIKEFPSATRRLFVNIAFMTVAIGHAVESAIVSGTTIFLTKYLEEQFRVTATLAANLTGICMVTASTVGVLIGGFYLRTKKPSLADHGKVMVIFGVISFLLPVPMLFLGCDQESFAGITLPYEGSSDLTERNLDSVCNSNCGCTPSVFNPVCGIDDVTYYSPCYASCVDTNLTECSCVATDVSVISSSPSTMGSPQVSPGMCDAKCDTIMITFVVIAFLYSFASGVPLTCDVLIPLRCVDEADKPFALA
ncbi:solute carrier organic anion transporter family member 3A1-like isoform X2 [Ptychodera flava]|uniref:solute carrier organic anion transporter family member 3A1-like isoform X2 n=1 Tax=Ptychodera flava TaxID=63121 RepID=UPI00396A03AB